MSAEVVKENLEMNIRWIELLPARQFPGYGNVVMAMRDALKLLKKYEPSLMSLEDVFAWAETKADERNPVFFESKTGECGWICRATCPKDYYLECLDGKARCWTSRPTDEQRKATPWGKEESAKGFLRPLTDARVFMAEAMKREDAEIEKCDEKNTDCKKMINELRFQLNSKEVKEHHDPVQLSITDAKKILAMLEMRMAKLLTPEEVFSPEFDGHVYVEILGVITPALVTWKTRETTQNWFNPPRKVTERFISTQQLEGNWLVEEDYGITWRCWNAKPSAEECKNSSWETQEVNEEKMLSDIYQSASDDLDWVTKDTVLFDKFNTPDEQRKATPYKIDNRPLTPMKISCTNQLTTLVHKSSG